MNASLDNPRSRLKRAWMARLAAFLTVLALGGHFAYLQDVKEPTFTIVIATQGYDSQISYSTRVEAKFRFCSQWDRGLYGITVPAGMDERGTTDAVRAMIPMVQAAASPRALFQLRGSILGLKPGERLQFYVPEANGSGRDSLGTTASMITIGDGLRKTIVQGGEEYADEPGALPPSATARAEIIRTATGALLVFQDIMMRLAGEGYFYFINTGAEALTREEREGLFVFKLTEEELKDWDHISKTIQRTIPGRSAGPGTALKYSATLSMQNPDLTIDAVIKPEGDYKTWLPSASTKQGQAGNSLGFSVELQDKKTGGPPKDKSAWFECQLLDTTNEPGSCMNSPWADTEPDLKFLADDNPHLTDVAGDGQSGKTKAGLTRCEVYVSCFDGAAYGRLKVVAHLSDGTPITAHLAEGRSEQVSIPYDEDGNHIADAWEKDNNVVGKDPSSDDDDQPAGNRFNGDGLTIWEEYRGFLEDGKHIRTDPHKKDLFICDTIGGRVKPGIDRFAALTTMAVHARLTRDELSDGRVINRNHSKGPHIVDQHGLLTWPSTGSSSNQAVGGPGTPKSCREVRLDTTFPDTIQSKGADGVKTYARFVPSVVHELLHCCSVWHHGESDETVWWHAETVGGTTRIYEYGSEDGVGHPDKGVPRVVYNEEKPDEAYVPSDPFWATPHEIGLGNKQGQHSGYEDCVMRYSRADAYTVGDERYCLIWFGGERAGQNVCTSPAGTGVNAPDHRPRCRYGDAADGRGDCIDKICVNDLYEPVPGGTGHEEGRPMIVTRGMKAGWWAAGLLVLAAGGGSGQAPTSPMVDTPKQSPAAALVLSPGALGGGQLYQSWPLIFSVSVWPEVPAGAAAPFSLKAKQGAWCEALVVTVKDTAGALAKWPLHLVKQDAAELALEAGGGATVEWWLAPEETKALAAGEYTITVAFDPQKVDGLPTDVSAVKADSFHIQVAREPAPLDPELQQEKPYQLARLCILRGDTAGASDLAAKILAFDPKSIGGRRLKAASLVRQGKASEALLQLDEALDIYTRKFPKACPPGGLLGERDQILSTLKPPATVKRDKTH